MPVYFEVVDKRSAVVVDPAANVLSVVAAKANRGCPAPAPAATAHYGPRLSSEDLTAEVAPPPPLPRQLLRERADGLRLASEDETA